MTIDQIVAICIFLLTISSVLLCYYTVTSNRLTRDVIKLARTRLDRLEDRQTAFARSLETEIVERYEQGRLLQAEMAKFGTKLYNINLKLGIKND